MRATELGFPARVHATLVGALLADLGAGLGAQPARDFDRNEDDLWRRRRAANAAIAAFWASARASAGGTADARAKDAAEADRARVDRIFREPRVSEMAVRTAAATAALGALRAAGLRGTVTCERRVALHGGLAWRPQREPGTGYATHGYVDLLVRGADGAVLPVELKYVPAKQLRFDEGLLRRGDFCGHATGAHAARLEQLRATHAEPRALWAAVATLPLVVAYPDGEAPRADAARTVQALLDRAGRTQLAAYAGALMKAADVPRGAGMIAPRTLRGLTVALVGHALLVAECWQYAWPRARGSTATHPTVDATRRARYLVRLPDGAVARDPLHDGGEEEDACDGLTDALAAVTLDEAGADDTPKRVHRHRRRRIRVVGAEARPRSVGASRGGASSRQ